MKAHILVLDREEGNRKLLKSRLERDGSQVELAVNVIEAQSILSRDREIRLLITDSLDSGKDGIALVERAREKNPNLKVIALTGNADKESAIRALRAGASNYFENPLDMDQLSQAVSRCLRESQSSGTASSGGTDTDLAARLEARAQRVEGNYEDKVWYVSKAKAMEPIQELLTTLRRDGMRGDSAESDVIILGEVGTGREGIARMIYSGSRRARGPWVSVNCAQFTGQLLEFELLGYERGAFNGADNMKRGLLELAQGGTLFLDEVGEMSLVLQDKLIQVLQEKVFRRLGGTSDLAFDVRIIAASDKNLKSRIKDGKFREAFYQKLSSVLFSLPPLRERSEDIVPMASQFAERSLRARGKAFGGFSPEAETALREYSWPGNVRELLSVIERAALLWDGQGPLPPRVLAIPSGTPTSIGGARLQMVSPPLGQDGASEDTSYTELKKKWCDSFEREYLITTLNKNGGNVSAAARDAKLDRSNFLRLLRRHRLRAQEYRKAA